MKTDDTKVWVLPQKGPFATSSVNLTGFDRDEHGTLKLPQHHGTGSSADLFNFMALCFELFTTICRAPPLWMLIKQV